MNQNFLDLDEMSVFGTDNPFNSEDIFVPMGSTVFKWGGGSNSHIMMAAYTW